MIIANGTLEVKHKEPSVIDPETGYPSAPSSVEWGEPILCQWWASTWSNTMQSNGEDYTKKAITALIETPAALGDSKRVRLKTMSGTLIGEFAIDSIEELDAVCQWRLTLV